MGVCASCLGRRPRDMYDDDDEAQHLFDDPHGLHYGAFDHNHTQEDPLEVQREVEALQRVLARTSENMIDVYEIPPPFHDRMGTSSSSPAFGYAYNGGGNGAYNARAAHYQNLLAKLSGQVDCSASTVTMDAMRVDWDDDAASEDADREDEGDEEESNGKTVMLQHRRNGSKAPSVKLEGVVGGDDLVGNFADAAAAMR